MDHAGIHPDVHGVGDLLVVGRRVAEQFARRRDRTRPRCPRASIRRATSSSSCGVSGCSSPVALCTNSGIGTPQARWRDTHQSGRPATMPSMRCWPQSGTHCTSPMARSACCAQPVLVEADEPLRCRAKDQRRLVAPAMRVAVRRTSPRAAACPLSAEHRDDGVVGLIDVHAGEARRAGDIDAGAIHRIVERQAVRDARREVVLAMAGRRVHRARARIERHVVRRGSPVPRGRRTGAAVADPRARHRGTPRASRHRVAP